MTRKPKAPKLLYTLEQLVGTLTPSFDSSIADLQAAIAEIGRCVYPVVELTEGSGRVKQIGTAFVVGHPPAAAIITAEHVVSTARLTGVAWPDGSTTRWPDHYAVLRPRVPGIPDADIAFFRGHVSGAYPNSLNCIPSERLAADVPIGKGVWLVAIGFPGSLMRVVSGARLIGNRFVVLGFSQDLATLPGDALDPRVHLALRYGPASMRELGGTPRQGKKPDGMSGGVVLVLRRVEKSGSARIEVHVVGVLVRYRPNPGVLIATRIACLADAIRSTDSAGFQIVEARNLR